MSGKLGRYSQHGQYAEPATHSAKTEANRKTNRTCCSTGTQPGSTLTREAARRRVAFPRHRTSPLWPLLMARMASRRCCGPDEKMASTCSGRVGHFCFPWRAPAGQVCHSPRDPVSCGEVSVPQSGLFLSQLDSSRVAAQEPCNVSTRIAQTRKPDRSRLLQRSHRQPLGGISASSRDAALAANCNRAAPFARHRPAWRLRFAIAPSSSTPIGRRWCRGESFGGQILPCNSFASPDSCDARRPRRSVHRAHSSPRHDGQESTNRGGVRVRRATTCANHRSCVRRGRLQALRRADDGRARANPARCRRYTSAAVPDGIGADDRSPLRSSLHR